MFAVLAIPLALVSVTSAGAINCSTAYMDIGAGTNYTYRFFNGWGTITQAAGRSYCQSLCSSGCDLAQGRFSYSATRFFSLMSNAVSGGEAWIGLTRPTGGSVSTMYWLDGRSCSSVASDSVCFNNVDFNTATDLFGTMWSGMANKFEDAGDNKKDQAICEFPGKVPRLISYTKFQCSLSMYVNNMSCRVNEQRRNLQFMHSRKVHTFFRHLY
jgi:hypothetical protein